MRAHAGQRRPRDANRAGAGGRGSSRLRGQNPPVSPRTLVGTPLERREGVGVCPGSGGVCARVSELHRGVCSVPRSHQREGGRGPVSGGSTNSPESWAPRAPGAASPRVVWPPLPLVGGGRYRRLPHALTSLAFGIFTVCFQARKFYLRKEGTGRSHASDLELDVALGAPARLVHCLARGSRVSSRWERVPSSPERMAVWLPPPSPTSTLAFVNK